MQKVTKFNDLLKILRKDLLTGNSGNFFKKIEISSGKGRDSNNVVVLSRGKRGRSQITRAVFDLWRGYLVAFQ